MAQDPASTSPSRPSRKFLCNPVKRFGHLALEPQVHDPLVGIFKANPVFVSNDPDRPLALLFSRDTDPDAKTTSVGHAWYTEGECSSYSIFGTNADSDANANANTNVALLCVVRPHHRSMMSWKRTVYATPASGVSTSNRDKQGKPVGSPIFNVRKSTFGRRPTYSAYLGGHLGADLESPPGSTSHPFFKKPFMIMSTSNNSTEFVTRFKFTAAVSSIRVPTGNRNVDQVLAVERKSQLVVLASTNIHDAFVFLRLGGGAGVASERWSWTNEHAPGMLIAHARSMEVESVNNELVGPATLKIQVAAGVDGRLIMAVVLAAVTHFQAY